MVSCTHVARFTGLAPATITFCDYKRNKTMLTEFLMSMLAHGASLDDTRLFLSVAGMAPDEIDAALRAMLDALVQANNQLKLN